MLIRRAYIKTRDRKMKGEVREFNFSQQYIFGVFESFCKRLKDLLDMFDNIRTFTQLFSTKLESLLAEEILVNDRIAFEQVKDGQKVLSLYPPQGCDDLQGERVRLP